LVEQRKAEAFNESLRGGVPESGGERKKKGRYDSIGTRVEVAESSVGRSVTVAAGGVEAGEDVDWRLVTSS